MGSTRADNATSTQAAESTAMVLTTEPRASESRAREDDVGVRAHVSCVNIAKWKFVINACLLQLACLLERSVTDDENALLMVARNGAALRKARQDAVIMVCVGSRIVWSELVVGGELKIYSRRKA